MICALLFIISNDYGIKCLSNLLQDVMLCLMTFLTKWHIGNDMRNTIVIGINFCNAKIK